MHVDKSASVWHLSTKEWDDRSVGVRSTVQLAIQSSRRRSMLHHARTSLRKGAIGVHCGKRVLHKEGRRTPVVSSTTLAA